MTRDRSYSIVCATVLVLFAAIFGFSHMPWCDLPIVIATMKGEQATTCVEFWINRYQSAIAAVVTSVVTLAAAAIAARFVWRQTIENRRQSDVAAFKIYLDLQAAIAERLMLCQRLIACVDQLVLHLETLLAQPTQVHALRVGPAISELARARESFMAVVLKAPRGVDRDASIQFATETAMLAQTARVLTNQAIGLNPIDSATAALQLGAARHAQTTGRLALVTLSTLTAATLDRLGDLQARILG